jgi:enamine deaminase RidA (YjgF/YER057c/UK114 family)
LKKHHPLFFARCKVLESPSVFRSCVVHLFPVLALASSGWLHGADLPKYLQSDPGTGTSQAVVVGDWPLAHTAWFLAGDADQPLPEGVEAQFHAVLDRLDQALAQSGSSLQRIVKLNVYVGRRELVADVERVMAARFHDHRKPACTLVVSRLPRDDALVAADAVATTDRDPGRAVQRLGSAPRQWAIPNDAASGSPRTTAAVALVPQGTRIYVAGQAERDEDLAAATRKTLQSLRDTLKFLGRSDADIVQFKAFLMPMTDAHVVEREVQAVFGQQVAPPLVLVEWKSSATTPIEIEMIAWGGMHHSGPVVEYLTPPGMTTSPVFSRLARTNATRLIFVSGLHAAAGPDGDDPNRDQAGAREVKDVFGRLSPVLAEAGSDLQHLVKATYYVATDAASTQLNALRPDYYDPLRPPAASKAAVSDTGRAGRGLIVDMIAVPAIRDAVDEYGPPEYGHGLSADDAAAGWLSLFDGQSTFGWQGASLVDGQLRGGRTTTAFGNCALRATVTAPGSLFIGDRELNLQPGKLLLPETGAPELRPIRLGPGLHLQQLSVRPLHLESLFHGRDLSQWKPLHHPSLPENQRAKWSIEGGAIRAQGGPGCVEYQPAQFGDLVLQLDVRTRLRHANGGVFFRAIPGDFMNGYEAQVYSHSLDGDPGRPDTWCTGGLDDHQNARRMVSRDGHTFRMTIIAQGPHLATWVNGYQQTDWTDERPPHDNPRMGRRVAAGVIQLQAHDPGTDVEFSNIAARAW